MTRALQRTIRPITGSEDVRIGMQLIRPVDISRARHRDGMSPERAALGDEQMIVSAALVKVRAFGEADRRAFENHPALADQFLLAMRIFLNHNAGKSILVRPM